MERCSSDGVRRVEGRGEFGARSYVEGGVCEGTLQGKCECLHARYVFMFWVTVNLCV